MAYRLGYLLVLCSASMTVPVSHLRQKEVFHLGQEEALRSALRSGRCLATPNLLPLMTERNSYQTL